MKPAPSPRNARTPRIMEALLARCAMPSRSVEATAALFAERFRAMGITASAGLFDELERRVLETHARRLPPERAARANLLVQQTMQAIRALLLAET